MENKNRGEGGFSYTYSAKEQAELRRIRDKYTYPSKTEDKMTRLRRLDASVTQVAQTMALIVGILGALLLGFGMSLFMSELGNWLGLQGIWPMAVGIAVGVVGGVLISLAYPVYRTIVKTKRQKLAPEIIRLADELMK